MVVPVVLAGSAKKLALQMKATSLTYMSMTPQIYICSTEVFRPPFLTAS